MQSLIQRLYKFIQSNAHALLNKFEDPIKLSEQAIRDLKQNFDESLKGLAEIKATAITTKRNIEEKKQIAADYKRKAMLLIKKANDGEISQEEADRLASEALKKKQNALEEVSKLTQDLNNYKSMSEKLESKLSDLKQEITKRKSELTTLKARYKVAKSTKKINQQLAKIGSESATAMLEDMKTKVQEEEALASAYDEMIYLESDIDNEINKAIGTSEDIDVQNELTEMKTKLIETKPDDPTSDLKDELN